MAVVMHWPRTSDPKQLAGYDVEAASAFGQLVGMSSCACLVLHVNGPSAADLTAVA